MGCVIFDVSIEWGKRKIYENRKIGNIDFLWNLKNLTVNLSSVLKTCLFLLSSQLEDDIKIKEWRPYV